MKDTTSQPQTNEISLDFPLKINPILTSDFDPSNPTGKKQLPSNWFQCEIFNSDGVEVGHLVGAICQNLDEIHAAIGTIRDQYLNRIPGGLRFPCAALRKIEIIENFWSSGFGSQGLKHFEKIATSQQCKIALTRRGWTPGMAEGPSKILRFYNKNGWERLDKDFSKNLSEPWCFKDLYVTC